MKCPKCRRHDTTWVGYSARALKRLRPAKDVVVCNRCGHTFGATPARGVKRQRVSL